MLEISDSFMSTVFLSVAFVVMCKVLKFFASHHEPNVQIHDPNCSHYWQYSDMVISIPLHCSVCHSLLLTSKGQFCSGCGIGCCTESACLRKANTTLRCKEIALTAEEVEKNHSVKPKSRSHSQSRDQNSVTQEKIASEGNDSFDTSEIKKLRHHWVAGNLPLNSECEVCEESCGDGPGIIDLRCCWCQRTVHSSCQSKFGEVCDLGEFRQFIVPHFCVVSKPGRTVMRPKRKIISKVISPRNFFRPDEWTPLIVIGNRKSGSKDTAAILANFRAILNPAQVIDLDECTIEDGLKWCQLIGDKARRCYCLIAGGDGTIGWVLNTVDKMGLENPPAITLFPLGTGNDLARSLGYGAGSDSSENLRGLLKRIMTADETYLDRWRIQIKPNKSWRFGMPQNSKEMYMQNYLSIGVDALVTYNFHKARESPLYLIPSRLINKLIYFTYGTKDVLERACKNLDQMIEVYMDGVKVDLPNIESVVVLNIPSWGAGVKPWTLGTGHSKFPKSSYNDEKLEVFCVFSSFHIAQMQVGLSEPHRLGQANDVRISLYGKVPIQIDGEPWVQFPAEIHVTHHKQVPVLRIRAEKFE